MKTYVESKLPKVIEDNIKEDKNFVTIVLSEQETYWVYHEDNKCHPFMIDLLKKKIEKVSRRYEKPIKVFDNDGKKIKVNILYT